PPPGSPRAAGRCRARRRATRRSRSAAPGAARGPAPGSPQRLPGGISEWRWYRGCRSLDADRADFLDMGNPCEALLHAVLLQRAHALLHGDGEHLGDARMLLDALFQSVARDEQLVQAAAPLQAAAATLVATDRLEKRQMALVAAVGLHPVLVARLHRALRVRLEPGRAHQLLAVLAQEGGQFGRLRGVGLLAAAQALGEALRQDAEQRIGEVERVHPHVEEPDDRLRRG